MSLQGSKKIKKFEERLKTTIFPGDETFKEMKEEEEDMLKKKLAAENEDEGEGEEQEEDVREDEDEVNSGWEEASEGASEFEMEESKEEERGEVEDISYEGDPEDVDEEVNQWSE